ncbi:hypothetical protein ACMBCN_01510 [Candidatus Liberibacter asiaticus]|nr:hypothetical protein [Candidatus Liberibacter asiaticus]
MLQLLSTFASTADSSSSSSSSSSSTEAAVKFKKNMRRTPQISPSAL